MWRRQLLLTFVVAILATIMSSNITNGEPDPFIDNAVYSKEGYDEIILVEDGRDNATFFKYLIINDYSEAPENWSETGFNDSAWTFGAAPFGDRTYNGVTPNTDWDTSGDNNKVILIRHEFYLSNEIIISAEFDAAFTNYCTPFLNGNQIYSERGGNAHGMEYWNDDGNEEIPTNMFNEGQNVLAVYGRDYVYGSGNQNRQWLDVQLKATVFKSQTEPIIFGDEVTILVDGGNQGNSSADEVVINATSNNVVIESITFNDIPGDSESNIWLQWTPELVGFNQLEIEISCNCSDTNYTNNLFILNITAHIYSLETTIDTSTLIVNQTRFLNTTFEVKNTGNVSDIVTLVEAVSNPNDWNIEFQPNNFQIEPNETEVITITAIIPSTYSDGNYSLTFDVQSSYNLALTKTLVESGRDNVVSWKWTKSDGYDELYQDTNWTNAGFNDTNWSNALAPFGDSSVDGVDYKTEWEGDNYAYFRHIVNISNIGIYENGLMKINVASNNFGNHYINGILVFGDLDQGDGHGADYWNNEVQVYTNYLSQGENIIASVVGNPTNAQWFDQEIEIIFPQANLWEYQTETINIQIHLDSTAPSTQVIEQGFYRNSSTFEIKWRDLSNSDDLVGYYIHYLEKVGSNLGEWQDLGFYTNESLNFTGENGKIYRFKSIGKDNLGNLEYKPTYDTEMMVDLTKPQSTLWLSEGDIGFTKLNGVTINWKPNESNDIGEYQILYREKGNQSWDILGTYNSIGSSWFLPYKDGTFELVSKAIDYAGNNEIKIKADVTITFDRKKPEIMFNRTSDFTGKDGLVLEISYKSENLSSILLQYARLLEGTENRLEWNNMEGSWEDDKLELTNLVDGYTYYFRAIPIDLANNSNPKDPYIYTITWENQSSIQLPNFPLKPVMSLNPLSNMKITVDENQDGTYEKSLQEFIGTDLSFMKANQYWIDYQNSEVVFGNGDYGYLPPLNASINFDYEAYDVATTIDTKGPEFVGKPTYLTDENNNITITWKNVGDATEYIIEYRKNLASSQWETIGSIENSGKDTTIYNEDNLSSGYHYYRISSVDRMGYINNNMEGDLLEVFIETEVNNVVTEKSNDDSEINSYIISASALLMLAGAGAYYFASRGGDITEENVPVLVPLDEVSEEGELPNEDAVTAKEQTFKLVEGSQFSRELIFVCLGGCQKEFTSDNEDDEVICPHCGMIGEAPL